MKNTKLVKLLKAIDRYEIRQLKDFIHSRVFNKNKNVSRLFDELIKFYPEFESERMKEEDIFPKVFDSAKFDYFRFRNASSDLFKLCMEFLSFIRYRNDNFLREYYQIQEAFKRGLDGIFLQALKSATAKNENSSTKDEHYLSRKIDLLEESISYHTLRRPNEFINLQQDKLDLFTQYALMKFLKLYNIMLHEKKQNNFMFTMNMFDEVIGYIEKNKNADNATIQIYYHIIMLEMKSEDFHFYKLKELRNEYYDALSDYDKYMSFLHMAGYCAQMYNVYSRTDLQREHFELNRDRNLHIGLADVGKILYPDFINEVKIALRVDEIRWAEDYMKRNKDKLEMEKDSTLNFCLGMICYKQGSMDEALHLLSKTFFPNFILKLQVKILQLHIYVEMNLFDQAYAAIDAFKHYLKREKTIKTDFKNIFNEYLRLVSALIKFKEGTGEDGYNAVLLNKEIEKLEGNQFGIKLWLKQQMKASK